MGAWFEHRELEDRDTGEIVVAHRSTGKGYPEGDYHLPDWGPWLSDSPMWTRYCQWSDGAKYGCDIEDHTFTNPKEQT